MTSAIRAGVTGVGMTGFSTRAHLQDWNSLTQSSVSKALDDSGLEIGDIDLVVFSQGPEALHGIAEPEFLGAEALGIAGLPSLRANTGGATGASAFELAWWAVRSGRYENVLVVGTERMGDNVRGAQQVLNEIWDPVFEAEMPLNTISMTALLATLYMEKWGAPEEVFALIASRMRENAGRNPFAHLREPITPEEVMSSPPLAWPIRRAMTCPRSSGSCAMVLSSESVARRIRRPIGWVGAVANRANSYFMGDRMGDAGPNREVTHELRLAAGEAYREAGIRDPEHEVDVVEPYVPFSTVEPTTLEALMLCNPGDAWRRAEQGYWDFDGTVPVSPAGGVMCTNPISISALLQVAQAAQQVRGLAGACQVGGADVAVAQGFGGSQQFSVVAVLESDSRTS